MIADMILSDGLTLDARRRFLEQASVNIERLAGRSIPQLVIDCSIIERVDDPVIGMLTVIARSAERRGLRVQLYMPSLHLRQSLDTLGVTDMFDTRLL